MIIILIIEPVRVVSSSHVFNAKNTKSLVRWISEAELVRDDIGRSVNSSVLMSHFGLGNTSLLANL